VRKGDPKPARLGPHDDPRSPQQRKEIKMRKLTAIIAALGFLGTTSLTPVLAAAPIDNGSVELSAQKKIKKAKRAKVKIVKKRKAAELQVSQDLSAQKRKAKRAKVKKPRAKAKTAEMQIIGDLSAQKKKSKRVKAKKPGSKAKAKSAAIYYRITA
jgi:hypothetical protein